MTPDVFIDTSGFCALLVRGDDRHAQATALLRQAAQRRRRFVTTDYVMDETATLLQVRGHLGLIGRFFETVFTSRKCRVVWMDPDRFDRTRALFLQRLGQHWSFTDCFSFVTMSEHRLREALTKDAHFRAAGFTPLLA
jgi:hypothetical protein